MALFKLKNTIISNLNLFRRQLSITSVLSLKEIKVDQEKDTLSISGKYVPSPNEDRLFKVESNDKKKFCLKCTLGLDVKHTDVLILSQFLRSDGCMLPRRITGLCKVQQKRIGTLVTMAQKAGLMANIAPAQSKKDPKKRSNWKRFNMYFDESTIKYRRRLLGF